MEFSYFSQNSEFLLAFPARDFGQKLNMERYRRGHNGADSKSVCAQAHKGSNPFLSATKELKRTVLALFFCHFWGDIRSFSSTFEKSLSEYSSRKLKRVIESDRKLTDRFFRQEKPAFSANKRHTRREESAGGTLALLKRKSAHGANTFPTIKGERSDPLTLFHIILRFFRSP